MALPSSNESVPPSSGEADLPHLENGELLAGRFTVLRFIARGGMGAVYEASDAMLRSRVALKVIRGRIAMDDEGMERFRREVLLARRVGHPNVCHVYELFDASTAAGVPIHFLTMELLEGETLSQRIARQGRLTTAEALPLVRQLCEGLAAAHAEGVVHRDFKSSNVMLVPRGDGTDSIRAAITDFGIARAARLSKGETRGSLTGGGAILGTPEYMAPEQVAGGAVTQASDIYALGVVLFEMVTGKLPFSGDTPLVAAAKRLNEAPPRPEAAAPDLDPRWGAPILRCLAREPERRFKSALDILPALERPRPRWSPRTRFSTMVLALAVAAIAAFKFLPALHKVEPPRPSMAAAPRPVLTILGFRDELASTELAWLPTAVSEALGRELAAAETSLRLVDVDRVADVRRSLGVPEEAVTDERVRERMQGLLAANLLVYGTLAPTTQGSAAVRLSLQMVDAVSRRSLASFEEELGEGASALAEKLPSLAERVRHTLGVSLTPQQAAVLSAPRERSLAAMRSYAQGVIHTRNFDFANARSSFDAALATDRSFLDAQYRILQLWWHEGNRKKARETEDQIRSRPDALTPRQLAELNSGETHSRQALFEATPDDLELGVELLFRHQDEPKTAAAILSRLRTLPPPASTDIRLDILEARVAWSLGERRRAEELYSRATDLAQALGARTEMALALETRGRALFQLDGLSNRVLEPLRKAATILEQEGELERLARLKRFQTILLEIQSNTAELKADEELAALYRKLGERERLASIFGSRGP